MQKAFVPERLWLDRTSGMHVGVTSTILSGRISGSIGKMPQNKSASLKRS
jgi:hypothetical protein